MRGPKILAVASAIDLDFRYGCTPAWWQLWKGLYEEGVDLVVTPYRGRPVESPWWRTAPNPTYREGESFARARDAVARLKGDRYLRRAEDDPDDSVGRPRDARGDLALGDAALAEAPRAARRARAARRGRRLHRADGAPARHPDGAARAVRHPGRLLRRRRADEPARVRRHGHRLQLVPRRRSVRVRPAALELRGRRSTGCASSARGAPRPSSGAPTPSSSRRTPVDKELDVFFYGYGDKFRRDWMRGDGRRAVAAAARRRLRARRPRLPGRHRAARALIGDVPFNTFARAISSARVNLCITRRSHATVYASSSCRPFELASSGAAIVSNPYEGIERWFEPGSELLVVDDADEAVAAYRALLDDPGAGGGAGPPRARARARRAHLPAPGAPAARPARAPRGSACRLRARSRSSPRTTRSGTSAA